MYEADFSGSDPLELHTRGFALALSPATLVVEQSRRATTWWIAKIAGFVLLALVGLVMLSSDGT